jgi:hypothetical protein
VIPTTDICGRRKLQLLSHPASILSILHSRSHIPCGSCNGPMLSIPLGWCN